MTGVIRYGGDAIAYEILFLATRKTLGIEVHPEGRVLVRAPAGCPTALIDERVRRRAAWISRQLADFERYRPRTPARRYLNGESHLYLGRQYRLRISRGPASVRLTRDQIRVVAPHTDSATVKALLRRWYLERARAVFGEIADASLRRFRGGERPRLAVRAMKSRWGSLSLAGTMTLNVDLVRAPKPCIEYVVVHELCHAKHRDHDGRFFKLLGQLMPDWERRKQRLESALL